MSDEAVTDEEFEAALREMARAGRFNYLGTREYFNARGVPLDNDASLQVALLTLRLVKERLEEALRCAPGQDGETVLRQTHELFHVLGVCETIQAEIEQANASSAPRSGTPTL